MYVILSSSRLCELLIGLSRWYLKPHDEYLQYNTKMFRKSPYLYIQIYFDSNAV